LDRNLFFLKPKNTSSQQVESTNANEKSGDYSQLPGHNQDPNVQNKFDVQYLPYPNANIAKEEKTKLNRSIMFHSPNRFELPEMNGEAGADYAEDNGETSAPTFKHFLNGADVEREELTKLNRSVYFLKPNEIKLFRKGKNVENGDVGGRLPKINGEAGADYAEADNGETPQPNSKPYLNGVDIEKEELTKLNRSVYFLKPNEIKTFRKGKNVENGEVGGKLPKINGEAGADYSAADNEEIREPNPKHFLNGADVDREELTKLNRSVYFLKPTEIKHFRKEINVGNGKIGEKSKPAFSPDLNRSKVAAEELTKLNRTVYHLKPNEMKLPLKNNNVEIGEVEGDESEVLDGADQAKVSA